MYLILNYVEDNFARTIISEDVLRQGEVVMIDGLADNALAVKAGVPLDGEAYKVVNNVDSASDLFVLVAGDGHRYEKATDYNYGDIADTPAGECVRGYILHKGMVVSVEEAVVNGGAGVNVGDKLCVRAGSHELTASAGTERMIPFKVIERYAMDGRNMIKLLCVL